MHFRFRCYWTPGYGGYGERPACPDALVDRPAAVQTVHMDDQPQTANGQPATDLVRTMSAVGQLYDLLSAAKLTGLTVDALRKRARRGRLAQVKGNDGTVRVQLTTADLEAIRQDVSSHRPDTSSEARSSPSSHRPAIVQTDPAMLERLARAEATVGELRSALEQAQGRADAAAALAETRRDDVTAALVRAARAEGEAEGLKEALREARKPAWRRLLGWD